MKVYLRLLDRGFMKLFQRVIMQLSFLMDNIGTPHKLNDQQSIQYMQLKQRKDLLTTQVEQSGKETAGSG